MRNLPERIRRARSASARRDIEALAGRSVRAAIAGAIDGYDRGRHLPRLIAVGPDEIADRTEAGRRAILLKLLKALRAERNRGRAGHWTYDLNRHIGLCQAFMAERRRFDLAAVRPPTGSSNENAGPRAGASGRSRCDLG